MKEEKRTQIMQKTAVVWFGALVCCALWGSAFPCIKIGYQMFEIDAADTAAQISFYIGGNSDRSYRKCFK